MSRLPAIGEALQYLLGRDAHQHFPGYLHLRKLSAEAGSSENIVPDWAGLGKYLMVQGGPPNKPYLRPFWDGQRNARQEWLNSNLAGSFAPSSLRRGPLRKVVDVNAHGHFSLKPDHPRLALEHLLKSDPIDAVHLATFLYRDKGLYSDRVPTVNDAVLCFRSDFGYGSENDDEFDTLYVVRDRYSTTPWFELWQKGVDT